MREAKLYTDIWHNPKFQKCSVECKLLWIWIFGNQQINDTGLYKITPETMKFETGIKHIEKAFNKVRDTFKIVYDKENCILWIVDYFDEFGNKKKSENQEKGIWNYLLQFINYPIYKDFYEFYNSKALAELPQPNTEEGLSQDELELPGKSGNDDIIIQDQMRTDIVKGILLYLNEKTGKKFSMNSGTKNAEIIKARINEGYKAEDFNMIVDNKMEDPYFIKNPRYLRPETLFCRKHFESYKNETSSTIKPKDNIDDLNKRLDEADNE